jgi:hypothetical protein
MPLALVGILALAGCSDGTEEGDVVDDTGLTDTTLGDTTETTMTDTTSSG